MPHFSAAEMVKIALAVIVILGTARVIAYQHPDSKIANAFLLLY